MHASRSRPPKTCSPFGFSSSILHLLILMSSCLQHTMLSRIRCTPAPSHHGCRACHCGNPGFVVITTLPYHRRNLLLGTPPFLGIGRLPWLMEAGARVSRQNQSGNQSSWHANSWRGSWEASPIFNFTGYGDFRSCLNFN